VINWKAAQAKLGLPADGIPGDGTFSAILRVIAPRAPDSVVLPMARALKTFAVPLADLSTPRRLAGYLSNTGNETGAFTTFQENLHYSADRMAAVWPGRYRGPDGKPTAKAFALAADPVAFANDVYGARMGNERDGVNDNDGYDYRGLGPLQSTGYDNFLAAEKLTGIPFTTQPALMAHPGVGTIGALAWWKRADVNRWYDAGNSTAARSVANTGSPGNPHPEGIERVLQYEAAFLRVLS
jgi:putative chitinase